MILTLERAGLISRQPSVARSIELLVRPEDLPILRKSPTRQNPCASELDHFPRLGLGPDNRGARTARGGQWHVSNVKNHVDRLPA
jgi:hypothetical protein